MAKTRKHSGHKSRKTRTSKKRMTRRMKGGIHKSNMLDMPLPSAENSAAWNQNKYNQMSTTDKNTYNLIRNHQLPEGLNANGGFAAMIILLIGIQGNILSVQCPKQDEILNVEMYIKGNVLAEHGISNLIAFYKNKEKKGASALFSTAKSYVGQKTGFSEIISTSRMIEILRDLKETETIQINICELKLMVNRIIRDIFPKTDLSKVERYTRANRSKNLSNQAAKVAKTGAIAVGSTAGSVVVGSVKIVGKIGKEIVKFPYTALSMLVEAAFGN